MIEKLEKLYSMIWNSQFPKMNNSHLLDYKKALTLIKIVIQEEKNKVDDWKSNNPEVKPEWQILYDKAHKFRNDNFTLINNLHGLDFMLIQEIGKLELLYLDIFHIMEKEINELKRKEFKPDAEMIKWLKNHKEKNKIAERFLEQLNIKE